jgi:hypothetical protein
MNCETVVNNMVICSQFESRSGYGYVSTFFCVVLACVGRDLASGRSPV